MALFPAVVLEVLVTASGVALDILTTDPTSLVSVVCLDLDPDSVYLGDCCKSVGFGRLTGDVAQMVRNSHSISYLDPVRMA